MFYKCKVILIYLSHKKVWCGIIKTEKPCLHRLYIDESGDHTFKKLTDPAHRYLSLLGVCFEQSKDYRTFESQLEIFKKEVFGKSVILHRSKIINKKGPFGKLRDPEIEEKFNQGLLQLIDCAHFLIFTVIIDKQAQYNKYAYPHNPYSFSLKVMLERYVQWLKLNDNTGDVMAESRGKEEDKKLQDEYGTFYKSGSDYITSQTVTRFLTTKDLKCKQKSANIAGLQLADLLAHPIKQTELINAGRVSNNKITFREKLWNVVFKKFHKNDDQSQVYGYGIKKLFF